MADARIENFNAEVEKVLTYLHGEFAKLQTGRANAALVENVPVDAYGQSQPLKAVAGVSVQDAKTIVVQPWDASTLGDIETALVKADIGINPVNDGTVIRLNLPPMTTERREQLVKLVHQLAEEGRISVRQQRQTVHDKIKDEEKDEDVRYTMLEELEKAVKAANEKIDETKKQKEEEVMTV
ncbi:MAG: ribosome recycling factor [Candidatus Peribacter sp.]|jgi:ribosome recycling factor|nr:ribosome recycling factor [Candidatus Peribacter sp.]MBT4392439.1 ribosome recycling factor [Candidatus Peribacter sp.]MBT4601231.1 ribosome recycling factor [Candidatus Peribacter sp.]MBT5149280.1 ribosome recycling factor [Candidatus Peribacter sp.]MBT5637104.1 ribosome recycling factor [Candidatus Peribacter sp.]